MARHDQPKTEQPRGCHWRSASGLLRFHPIVKDLQDAGAGRPLSSKQSGGRWPPILWFLLVALAMGAWAARSLSWLTPSRKELSASDKAGPAAVKPVAASPPTGDSSAPPSQANQPLREEALRLADRLAHEFPQSADAIYVRGLLLNRYGENAKAVQCWEACLRLAPGFALAYERIGIDALKRGQNAEAASLLRKAAQLDPNLEDANLRLAESLLGIDKIEEAVSVLERHVTTWPDSVEGHYRLGQAYTHRKAHPQAKNRYERAIQLDPACTPAHYGLAATYAELGDAEKAREYRERFQKLKQQDMLAQKSGRRDHDDSTMLRETLAAANRAAGVVYTGHGNSREAEACWRRAAELDPKDTLSRHKLAMLLAKQNKTAEALQVVEELRRIEPENPDHWLSLGTLRARLKRFDAAESAFRRAISLGPKRAEGRTGLVQMLLATGRNLPEAKTLAQTAVELQPTAENYFVLSAACLSVRDLPGARAAIREATTRDPDNPKYREALGYLQQKLK